MDSTAGTGGPRLGVLHSDGSITVLVEGATPTECAAEAALLGVTPQDAASPVILEIAGIRELATGSQ